MYLFRADNSEVVKTIRNEEAFDEAGIDISYKPSMSCHENQLLREKLAERELEYAGNDYREDSLASFKVDSS